MNPQELEENFLSKWIYKTELVAEEKNIEDNEFFWYNFFSWMSTINEKPDEFVSEEVNEFTNEEPGMKESILTQHLLTYVMATLALIVLAECLFYFSRMAIRYANHNSLPVL